MGLLCVLVFAQGLFAYDVKWIVNGDVVKSVTKSGNYNIEHPSNPTGESGWEFVGWTESTTGGTSTKPSLVANGTKVNKQKTYYAVFCKQNYQYVLDNDGLDDGEIYIFVHDYSTAHYSPNFRNILNTLSNASAKATVPGQKVSVSNNAIPYSTDVESLEVYYSNNNLYTGGLIISANSSSWYLGNNVPEGYSKLTFQNGYLRYGGTNIRWSNSLGVLGFVLSILGISVDNAFYVNNSGSEASISAYKKELATSYTYTTTYKVIPNVFEWTGTSASKTEWNSIKGEDLSNTTIIVDDNQTMTFTDNAEVKTIIVRSGATLQVNGDKKILSADTLVLEGGWGTYTTKVNINDFDVPQVITSSTSYIGINKVIYYDLSIDYNNYYPLAVPCSVRVSDINYKDPTIAKNAVYNKHFFIRRYNGQTRADYGKVDACWEAMSSSDYLVPGEGYVITARTVGGKAVIRIPLTLNEPQANISTVSYTGAMSDINNFNDGWNMIGLPFISEANFLSSEIQVVNMPDARLQGYTQQLVRNDAVKPFWSCFVQVGSSAVLAPKASPSILAPVRTPARTQEREHIEFSDSLIAAWGLEGVDLDSLYDVFMSEMEIPAEEIDEYDNDIQIVEILVNSSNGNEDHLGLLMSDYYTSDFDLGSDTEKMKNLSSSINVYAIANDAHLVYNAFNPAETTSIPVGYRAGAGTYTFALDNRYAATDEEILLYDSFTGITTNLLLSDYTFDTDDVEDETRFVLLINQAPAVTTNMDNLNSSMRAFGEQNIMVISGLEGEGVLWVYDIEGKLVAHNTYTTATTRVAVPAGVYMVRAEGNTNGMVKAIVK